MQSKVILATLLVTAASADNFMVHPQMRRDLEARATATQTSIFDSCEQAILSAYSDVPTPPADIISDALNNPQTDPCHFSTPASLSKEYKSYSSEIMSWYSGHSKSIADAIASCPSLSNYATMVPTCDKGSKDSQATATSGSDSADSTKSSSSSDKTGAASRNAGMVGAAVAAAGFVVALL